MLAKNDSVNFVKLVDRAKYHGNKGDLRIVFVSSEGHVIPLMKSTSSSTRSIGSVIEVLDIDDEAAVSYLVKQGMGENLSKRVVEVAGGRFVYLIAALKVQLRKKNISEEDLFDSIKHQLVNVVEDCLGEAVVGEVETNILRRIQKKGSVKPLQLQTDVSQLVSSEYLSKRGIRSPETE